MNRHIKQVAILGSGVMGSRIACHFANIGVSVLLLDIAAKEGNDKNKIVNDALAAAVKSNPSPLYKKDFVKHIRTGNFSDHMKDIAPCDWVIEVVVENLAIKQEIFAEVEKYRRAGTIISSNTSGIPIHLLCEGRSDDFKKHFCGTHFFNPPRYLRLLEIIPVETTSPELVEFLLDFGDRFLGKTTVLCNDTPAFIANRVGVFSIMAVFHLMKEIGLSVDEIDSLTGPVIGHPKSATFRTCDVVGIDTLVKVAKGVAENCPGDEAKNLFAIPSFLEKMVEQKWFGDKSGQGFYKKTKSAEGKKEILTLDIASLEYKPKSKTKFATLELAKQQDDLRLRLKMLVGGQDKAAEFYRRFNFLLFSYISHRVPEITNDFSRIDDAIKAGFGWEMGPFEQWDVLGVEESVKRMEAAGISVADWVKKMIAGGKTSFYKTENGKTKAFDQTSNSYSEKTSSSAFIILENFSQHIVFQNSGTRLLDIGDGILNLEFRTKMNSIGGEVLEGVNKSIELAEKDFRGLVIGNDGQNFSAGANLALMLMFAMEQEYDELEMAARYFQNTSMRIRYSSVPVVVAPHGLTLGGGCEFCLHADSVQSSAETYIGLVEVGVGIIPAGGGSKEMTLRASDHFAEGAIEFPELQNRLLTIALAKVATSAHEAFDLKIFREGIDAVSINQSRLIADAKRKVIELAEAGYVQPQQRTDIRVLGRSALGTFLTGINAMYTGNYMSEHDKLISEKLAYVMSGGDLSEGTLVSEEYLLALEREAFLSLVTTKKSMERIQSILTTGKPLRN